MADSPWPTIHAERKALADDLASISDDNWTTPSLCTRWTVHQALAHMTATAAMTKGGFFGNLMGAGFNFDKMSDKGIATYSSGGPAATLAEFRRLQDATTSPPGPVDSWLGETIIHGEDIRRPLGIKHEYPTDGVKRVLDFYKKSNLIVGAKKRIAGLTLRATDIDWSHGSGPEVSGPGVALVLAMTGRTAALADLSGDGVDTLRNRS